MLCIEGKFGACTSRARAPQDNTSISYSLEESVRRKSIGRHSSRREPASRLSLIMGHGRIDPISHYGFNRVSFAPGPL